MKPIHALVVLAILASACGGPTQPTLIQLPDSGTKTTPPASAAAVASPCVANRWANAGVLERGPVDGQPGVRGTVHTVPGATVYLTVYKMTGDTFFPQHKVGELAFVADIGTVKVGIVATSSRENVVLSCVSGPDVLSEAFYTDDNYIDGVSWP